MKLLALHCRNCGAPVEVPRHLRYVKCTYCQAELSVEDSKKPVVEADRSSSAPPPSEATTAAQKESWKELMEVRMKITRLNASWNRQRMRYAQNGVVNVPTKRGAIMLGLFPGLLGLFFLLVCIVQGDSAPAVTGFYLFVIGFFGWFTGLKRAEKYEAQLGRYRRRRREHSKRLAELKGAVDQTS